MCGHSVIAIRKTVMAEQTGRRIVVSNRKARHEYEILETYDAGIVLTGTEIKSIRAGKVSLADAYAKVERGELWLLNMHIAPYEFGNRFNVESRRPRKLLMHKLEIARIASRVMERGLALIPLSVFLQRGYAKVQLGVGRGKKLYDKRQDIADRDREREARREMDRRQERD